MMTLLSLTLSKATDLLRQNGIEEKFIAQREVS